MIVLIGLSADLATKWLAFSTLNITTGETHWIIDQYVGFQNSLNEGALFGLGQGMVPIFATLSVIAFVGICYWLFARGAAQLWLLTIALSLICAGILGNLYDRLGFHGLKWTAHRNPEMLNQPVYAVRDFILFQVGDNWRWPNFNLADSFLVCGAGLLLWHAFCQPATASGKEKGQPSSSANHDSVENSSSS